MPQITGHLIHIRSQIFVASDGKQYLLNDYICMCANNAIISNNRSDVLIAVRCLHNMSRTLHSILYSIFIILIIY